MRTARLMGVNLGHRAVGSNAWQFMQRLGVNAARLFLYTTIPCASKPCALCITSLSVVATDCRHRMQHASFRLDVMDVLVIRVCD